MPQEEKSRRLLQGDVIIYPYTKQENVIGLQKTITDKLPIVSNTAPSAGFVQKQVWLDISGEAEEQLTFGSTRNTTLTFGESTENEVLTFEGGND